MQTHPSGRGKPNPFPITPPMPTRKGLSILSRDTRLPLLKEVREHQHA